MYICTYKSNVVMLYYCYRLDRKINCTKKKYMKSKMLKYFPLLESSIEIHLFLIFKYTAAQHHVLKV